MLRLQQISQLRLIVSVPEADVAGVTSGARINFTVSSFPGENFAGVIERISHTLDEKTRTMPVELDVMNDSGRLAPGMFAEVIWPTRLQRKPLTQRCEDASTPLYKQKDKEKRLTSPADEVINQIPPAF
jgi:membrane fusion protein, multidrug efflux system